jgi:tetratricopeptide (TPR) repeat protein
MTAAPLKYNPGILGDEELVRSFVVRHRWLDLILEMLRENAGSASSNRHLLIVGPRGIGKTMLVRRAAAEIRSNAEYGKAWFPIVFGEESYQVGSAGEFWLEALFHLAGSVPDELLEEHKDARLRERALGQLLDVADKQGKRLLLVVENLNMLGEQITSEAMWELRHTLLNEPRVMLLGTATSRFDAIDHADQAWFDLFAVHELKPLDRDESDTLWRSVTRENLKPEHLRAIRILTGGNPRLLTVLAGFAANRSFRELMEQLVHLIDEHTEYFKGHLDALAPKERKVFVALLEKWDPVTAADLARATRMGVNEVSALLSRLVSRGAVELFEQRPRRKLYQAAERLYNIYYLMRRRGQPADRVRAAVSFIVMFYEGGQLAAAIADLAQEACGLQPGKSEDHFQAFQELLRLTPNEVWMPAIAKIPPEFFAHQDAPELIRALAGPAALLRAFGQPTSVQWRDMEKASRDIVERVPHAYGAWVLLGAVFIGLNQLEEAERAFHKATDLEPGNAGLWALLGIAFVMQRHSDKADHAFRKALDLDPKLTWRTLIRALLALGRLRTARRLFRTAIESDPEEADVIFRELDESIELTGRTADALNLMSRYVLISNIVEGLPHAESWAREAWQKNPTPETAETLALAWAAQGKWKEALQMSGPFLNSSAESEGDRQRVTEVLIRAAAAGHAQEALKALTASKAAAALEPLIIGLRIYLGESPQVAKEILEIGQDVAERIRSLTHEGASEISLAPSSTPTS